MYLLDTNVVSELRKAAAGRAHPGVVEWANAAPAEFMFLSAISLHELEYGVRLALRRDQLTGRLLHHWLHRQVTPAFGQRILAVSAEAALEAARFMVPDPVPLRDALIAATAAEHDLVVVTRNTRDFERCGSPRLLNPWV